MSRCLDHVRLTPYPRCRAGQVLVEFALIAFILFLLLAAILDFGRALYAAQLTQQAVDSIARDISHLPLPPKTNFDLDDPAFRDAIKEVYSEDFLVIDLSGWTAANQDLLAFLDATFPTMPSGNKLLIPLMVVLDHQQNSQIPDGSTFLVYPGALVASGTAASKFTVRIPMVTYPAEGVEKIAPMDEWLRVLEPIKPDPFSLTSPQRGLVALRLNYPFQAAAMSGTNAGPNGPATPQGAYIEVPPGEDLQAGQKGGPYSGPTGLGQQAAFTKTVRPFRRVLSSQAIYRREVFK